MMNRIVLGLFLLSGCSAMAAHLADPSAADSKPAVRILAAPAIGLPTRYSLRAETAGLKPPLRFHWSLGNGTEWEGPKPPPQSYDGGRYNVIVTVTDADGHVGKTSLTIEVEGEHEH